MVRMRWRLGGVWVGFFYEYKYEHSVNMNTFVKNHKEMRLAGFSFWFFSGRVEGFISLGRGEGKGDGKGRENTDMSGWMSE